MVIKRESLMNKKKLFILIFGLFALQLVVPNYKGSEITQPKVESYVPEYAIENPTKTQVKVAQPTDLVVFSDSELENIISSTVRVPVGEITVRDMGNFDVLKLGNSISNLSGLEYAVNLKELYVSMNTHTDLTPISNLENLEKVELTSGETIDIAPLANVVNLQSLDLKRLSVSDFTPLSSLTNLKTLNFQETNFNDFSTIANLEKIEEIEIFNPKMKQMIDFPYMGNLKSLRSLNLIMTMFNDFTPLGDIPNLKTLMLQKTNITNLSQLRNLSSLENLSVTQVPISDLKPISELQNLKFIMLNGTQVSDLTPLSQLLNLESIVSRGTNISDLSPLSNLPKLDYVEFPENQISDISMLTGKQIDVTDQIVNLPDKIVYTDDDLIFNFKSVNDELIPINFGKPMPGENILNVNTDFFKDGYKVHYSASITQKVTFLDGTWKNEATVLEGVGLTNEELKTLFDIFDGDTPFVVNQSTVDYNVPGRYPIEFIAGTFKINSTLIIKDRLPVLQMSNPSITIKIGEKINDYVTKFGITATEIIHSDLTHKIIIDDSKVNYNKIGNYPVIFKITDDEGNIVEEIGNVVIEQKDLATNNEKNSKINKSSNKFVPKSEVNETNNNKTMTVDRDNVLTTTGSKQNIIIIIMLSFIVIVLLALKQQHFNDTHTT